MPIPVSLDPMTAARGGLKPVQDRLHFFKISPFTPVEVYTWYFSVPASPGHPGHNGCGTRWNQTRPRPFTLVENLRFYTCVECFEQAGGVVAKFRLTDMSTVSRVFDLVQRQWYVWVGIHFCQILFATEFRNSHHRAAHVRFPGGPHRQKKLNNFATAEYFLTILGRLIVRGRTFPCFQFESDMFKINYHLSFTFKPFE